METHTAFTASEPNKKFFVEITNEAHKLCRRVGIAKNLGFVPNLDVAALTVELSEKNTKYLYEFIKAYSPDMLAVLKKTAHGLEVRCKGYIIRFASHGYEIVDSRNNYEVINFNDFNNDYDNPRRVLDFLKNPIKFPTQEDVSNGFLDDGDDCDAPASGEFITSLSSNRLIAAFADNLYYLVSVGEMTADVMRKELSPLLSDYATRYRVGKILNALPAYEIGTAAIQKEIISGATRYTAAKYPLEFYNFRDSFLKIDDNLETVYTEYIEGDVTIRKNYTRAQFLWRVALGYDYTMYGYLLGVANSGLFDPDAEEFHVDNFTIEWDSKKLDTPNYPEELLEALERIVEFRQIDNPLTWDMTRGALAPYTRVSLKDNYGYYEGVIVSRPKGSMRTEVRLKSGDVITLLKGVRINKLSNHK
jgi:hypothetical protein